MSRFNDSLYFDPESYAVGFISDDLYECSVCHQEDLDPNELIIHFVNDEPVCQECITCCEFCGEYVDDDHLQPGVRFRRSEMDGKLSDLVHASCAAEHIAEMLEVTA